MKAVGFYKSLPISDPHALQDVTIPDPTPTGSELKIHVEAIAVNPIDCKMRNSLKETLSEPKILGWDVAGVVETVGDQTSLFRPGDLVFYSGDLSKTGAYAEYHLVDEKLVGHKPKSLTFEEAAALPLTALTAWEALFDRLKVKAGKTILIIGGAGGVGSIAIQLASKVALLKVYATASRKDSSDWCFKLGATQVLNHAKPLTPQMKEMGIKYFDYILILNNTDQYFEPAAEMIAPQGAICSIVEAKNPVNISLLKGKSAAFMWESMATRARYQTPDMIEQHRILDKIAILIDTKVIMTTIGTVLKPINAENLRKAHAMIEEGKSIGKIVLINA